MTALNGLSDGSSQIKNLPWLPSSVPLKAIAGNVTLDLSFFGHAVLHQSTNTDLVVSKGSALHGMAHPEKGGGEDVVSCGVTVAKMDTLMPMPNIPTKLPNCWHSALPHNLSVQSDVLDAIRANMGRSVTFHGLMLRIPQGWHVVQRPQGIDEMGVATSCTPNSYFFSTPCPVFWVVGPKELSVDRQLFSYAPGTAYVPASDVQPCRGLWPKANGSRQLWVTSNRPPMLANGSRPVGPRQAIYREWLFHCGTLDQSLNGVFHVVRGHDFVERTWNVGGLLIVTLWDVPGLNGILAGATWN